MELRQLQYALQIAAEKNFSRAAEKLHIAQPSLSQQLSKLEKELGVLLFQRNTNSVELTHAGYAFMEKAQMILDMVGQLEREMEDISDMKKGRLNVGSLPITGSHVLPRVLPLFHSRFPGIEIHLIEDTTNVLENLTAAGRTDISLLTLPVMDSNLSWEPLLDEEILLAVPPSHPLAKKAGELAVVGIRQLRDEAFIVLKRGQGFRQIALELCRSNGFEPRIVFESSNIETVQSLVAAGMGIAFVPSMIALGHGSSFRPAYLQLKERPYRTLVAAYRKGRYISKAAEAFMGVMREVMDNGSDDSNPGKPISSDLLSDER
ncbi:LysR family transcriptional regulator [Paenibacillus sp. YN15]|uniref:LysR family transcriptional regulator n=1 Tax=Paenibacillus sp. YN15 TaxID=1742774 RepID=UPI000DCD2C13|nr:LysR family transcriptional regulator [Paenibacillus sp. YN15]RAU95529.1 LysR family transcriptional regulator [Paenibacillus sp. YN15]